MLTENNAKIIRSLSFKKYRYKYNLFLAEGAKTVLDMLHSGFKGVDQIFISQKAFDENADLMSQFQDKVRRLTVKELAKISNLDSAPEIMMTGYIPPAAHFDDIQFEAGIHLYLDQVQDPGNVGTMLRTAEWFGVSSIGFSEGCADMVHPKVIQASMGSFCRVRYWTGDLTSLPATRRIVFLGAELSGENLYHIQLPPAGVLVIGSEGQGISNAIKALLTKSVNIPSHQFVMESLNAATAAAIILAEWRRQLYAR